MAQTNYTPISLYYSATATNVPVNTNLVAGELAINTADGKLFYKDSSGVVQVLATKGGVGTSSTTQVLYNSSGLVVGSAGLTFDGTNLATTGTATATRFIPSGSTIATNGLYLPAANSLGFSTNSTEAMRIDSSGNVGIGTSSPSRNLTVYGTNATIAVQNSTTGSTSSDGMLIQQVGLDSYLWNLENSFFSFGSNAAERIRINANGDFLIGTSTGTASGGYYFTVGSSSNFDSGHATGTASGATFQRYAYAGSVIGSISQSGTTAVLYNVTSDQRLKENIVDAPSGNINDIKVRSFDWITDGTHQTYGMVAQELLEVAPYAVHQPQDPEEMMAVDYSKLVPMMIKEIQELKAEIDLLKGAK